MAAYPRKQTVVIFMICAIAVLGVSYYVNGRFIPSFEARETTSADLPIISPITSSFLPENSDWKKQFLGSNATSTILKSSVAQKSAEKPEVLTATAILGRDFLTKYAQLSQAGLTTDQKTVNSIMGQVTADNIANLPKPKVYTLSQLKIVPDSQVAMKGYSNTIKVLFDAYVPTENEVIIATDAMEQKDLASLIRIDPIIKNYKIMLSNLLSTAAPKRLQQHHLDLINGLSMVLFAAQSMRTVNADPMQTIVAIGWEKQSLDRIQSALSGMRNVYKKAGLAFAA